MPRNKIDIDLPTDQMANWPLLQGLETLIGEHAKQWKRTKWYVTIWDDEDNMHQFDSVSQAKAAAGRKFKDIDATALHMDEPVGRYREVDLWLRSSFHPSGANGHVSCPDAGECRAISESIEQLIESLLLTGNGQEGLRAAQPASEHSRIEGEVQTSVDQVRDVIENKAFIETFLQRLHPSLREAASRRLLVGHGDDAVVEASKLVAARVRDLSGIGEDGQALMTSAFSLKAPRIRLNALASKTDISEQLGYMDLAKGLIGAGRNPRAHRPAAEAYDALEVLEWLSVASLIMRRLDGSEIGHEDDTARASDTR